VVCLSVGRSRCDSPAKKDKPIEMPFRMWIRIGQGNHVFHGVVQMPTREWEILRAKRGRPRTCLTCPAVDILKATQ